MFWNLLLEGTEGAEASASGSGGSPWGTYIMLGVIVLALIGMFIWQSFSNKKKQKEAQEALSKIKVGDRVKTIGGICGFIAEIRKKDNTFVLETGLEGNTCFIRFDMGAIYQTAAEGEDFIEDTSSEPNSTEDESAPSETVETSEVSETAETVETSETPEEEAPVKKSKKKKN